MTALTDLMHNDNGEAVIMQGDDITIEEWRPTEGFPGYDVSNHGRVRSWLQTRTGLPKIRLLSTFESGHKALNLRREGRCVTAYVHRLVLFAFVGPCPEGKECLHGDGDPANNRVGNLRWGTSKENSADRIRHGSSMRGEKSPHAKLTEADVVKIRAGCARRVLHKVLAARFGVSPSCISAIVRGLSWGHVPIPAPVMNTGRPTPTAGESDMTKKHAESPPRKRPLPFLIAGHSVVGRCVVAPPGITSEAAVARLRAAGGPRGVGPTEGGAL